MIPTAAQIAEHRAYQERLEQTLPGCFLTGRSAWCPTCKASQIVTEPGLRKDVACCSVCKEVFVIRRPS